MKPGLWCDRLEHGSGRATSPRLAAYLDYAQIALTGIIDPYATSPVAAGRSFSLRSMPSLYEFVEICQFRAAFCGLFRNRELRRLKANSVVGR